MSFTLIPALDLMAGRVVLADAGKKQRYRSLRKYSDSDNPVQVLAGLLRNYDFECCYIADLDALQGRTPQYQGISELCREFPHLEFWLDSGSRTEALPQHYNWKRVLGQEGIALAGNYRDYVLSLDFPATGNKLTVAPSFPGIRQWPQKVILMELGIIGCATGPNLERLKNIRKLDNMRSSLYLSGGIRHYEDVQTAAAAGAAGVICATALHRGSIDKTLLRRLLSACG